MICELEGTEPFQRETIRGGETSDPLDERLGLYVRRWWTVSTITNTAAPSCVVSGWVLRTSTTSFLARNLTSALVAKVSGKPNEVEAGYQSLLELRTLHREMDEAVVTAYGWTSVSLGHDFYELEYLPQNDRVRYASIGHLHLVTCTRAD